MRLFGTAALAFAVMAQASATLTFFNSRAALGATDYIDWSQVGPELTPVPGSYLGTSNLGTQFLATTGADALTYVQSSFWTGNFAPGDAVLSNSFAPGPMTIRFANSQSSVGTQFESDFYGDFDATISVYNNLDQLLGTYTAAGSSNGNGDNSAVFLGVFSSNNDIGSVVLSTTNDGAGFGINRVDMGPCHPVPEPASMAALGMGALALIRRRRKA